MSKKVVNKSVLIAESILWAVFVVTSSLATLSLLEMVALKDSAQVLVGYTLGGYAALVFGYISYKAVQNK